MYSMKESAIRDYIAKINFRGDWNYRTIESDMRKFLGEFPGIEPIYEKDVMLNEVTGTAKEIKRLDKLNIVFTDLDNKMKKITINID